MIGKRTKFGIFILVITILFSAFLFFEEVIPDSLMRKQNRFVSNTLSDTINWLKGNSFYKIKELNLVEKGDTLSGGEDIILGKHENIRLKYTYPIKKNSSPDLRISIDISKNIIDYSYQFKDDNLYLYISGLKVGSTTLTIENSDGKVLDTQNITVVKEIDNIPYDLELNATSVKKNDCLNFDYNFLSANQNILESNAYKVTDYYRDYYNYRDAYMIDGSNFYITNYMIFLLTHNSLSFTTDSEHIQINPTMGTIYVDKDCPSGIHTFVDNLGRSYSFEVLDQIYEYETAETKLNVDIITTTGRYLIENTINGNEFHVTTDNLPQGLTYSISFENECFYAIPSYYGDGNGGFYRNTGFYVLTDDYSNNGMARVFTLNYDKNGNRLYSDDCEVIIYTSNNKPINPHHQEMKTWSINAYYENELISENQDYDIEVGKEYIFYILIDGKELNQLDPALTMKVSDPSIISAVVDVEASTITIKCLKLGSSTVTFGDYYKNPHSFSFKTDGSYFIEEMGGLTIQAFVQNIGHFLCYVMFGLLLALTLFTAKGRNYFTLKTLFIGLGISITYGPLAESLQGFIPGRYLDIIDILLNLGGSLLGLGLMMLLLFIIKKTKQQSLFVNEKDKKIIN